MMAEGTTSEAAPTLWQKLRYTRLSDALRFRFNASLDWRRVLAAADLPAELKQVVYDTVRATRLWNREKVDVTRELVDHFLDGLDRGRPAPILAATFGDPKQSAALIRRAKKRGRPLVWQLWHYGWMTTATGMAAYLFLGLWMMMGRAHVAVDYLAIINRDAVKVPENERAWPLYRAALLAMGPKSSAGTFYPDVTIPDAGAGPGREEWTRIEKLLQTHQDAIGKLREAAGRPGLGFVPAASFAAFSPEDLQLFDVKVTAEERAAYEEQTLEDRWLIGTLLPNVQVLRTAALVLGSDARRAAAAGDGETALADVKAILGVSHHASETPFLINVMISIVVQQVACDTIAGILADKPQLWTNSELQDLAHTLAATPVDWRRGFVGETASFHDAMQRLYTDDGQGDGRLALYTSDGGNVLQTLNSLIGTGVEGGTASYMTDAMTALMLPTANFVVASRKEMSSMYDAMLDHAITMIGAPLWKQDEIATRAPYPLTAKAQLSDDTGLLEGYRFMFVEVLVPAFDALRNRVAMIDGARDGVLIGIALELYHREYGTWPASLDELSPRWLPAVPVDRITGGLLGYQIIEDRPLVYSLGTDGRDDGGRPRYDRPENAEAYPVGPPDPKSAQGDWVIWSTVPAKQMPKWEPVEMGAE